MLLYKHFLKYHTKINYYTPTLHYFVCKTITQVLLNNALLDLCLLYTSDAADERSSVDLGGRRIIKKKKNEKVCGSDTNRTIIKSQ